MAYSKYQLNQVHNFEWYGREGMSASDSIAKYGIAVRCLKLSGYIYDCYAPDPDDEDCCIRFKVGKDELVTAVASQTDVANFLLESGFMFAEFANKDIADILYIICLRYDIMALLSIDDPPTYLREEITFMPNEAASIHQTSSDQ